MTKRNIVLLLLACAVLVPSVRAEPLDRIVLRVNDQIATLADYERVVAERRQALFATTELTPEQRQELLAAAPAEAAENLYEELMILSRAQQLGLDIPEGAVDDAERSTRERMGLSTEAELQEALVSSGMTREDLRERLRRNLAIQQVMATEVRERIEVPEERLRKIYRETQERFRVPAALSLREIVVLAETVDDREQREEAARAIVRELEAGIAFEEVAAREAAAGTTTEIIDLGWVEQGDLDPELEAAAWSLEPGAVSEPVDARGGHHILQVVERRESYVRPFEEVRERLAARERESHFANEYAEYLRELENRAYVVFDLPPEAASFRGFVGDPEPDETLVGDDPPEPDADSSEEITE